MASNAPKVQSLSKISASLNPAYASSKNIINKQKAALPQKYDAQRSAIKAERGEGFNAINNQATGRGGSFSGIPQDEQARYLSTKFLPGMQMADYQQNEEGLRLSAQMADINKEQRLQAMGIRERQVSRLNDWRTMQAQQRFQARQAELNRQAEARLNASRIAASRAQAAPPTWKQQVVDSFSTWNSSGDAWKKNFSTERLIQNIVNEYSDVDAATAKKYVYGRRKQIYGF